MILWVVLCFMVLAGTKIAGRCKCPHLGGELVLTADWQFLMWDFTWPFAWPYTARQLESKMMHSKQRGESCRSVMAEPWKLVSHATHSTGQRSDRASPGSRREKANTFQWEECQGIAAMFKHRTAHSLTPNLHSHAYQACSHSPKSPPPKVLAPTASSSGFKSRIVSPKSGPQCYETMSLSFFETFTSSWKDLGGTTLLTLWPGSYF